MKTIRKLGLAAVAALALTAFGGAATASASPSGFLAGGYPAVLSGSDTEALGSGQFEAFGVSWKCSAPSFDSTAQAGPSSTLQVDEYTSQVICSGPTVPGGSTPMNMNGCKFSFDPGAAPSYDGTLGIGPPGCGPIYAENMFNGCDFSINPGAGYAAVSGFENNGEAIEIAAEATGLEITKVGGPVECPPTPTKSGRWYPQWEVTAVQEDLEPVSLGLVAELPFGFFVGAGGFEAETYPQAIGGGGLTTTAGSITFTCAESSLQDTVAAASESLTLDATYASCKGNLGGAEVSTVIDMKTCHYTQSSGAAFGIACGKEGDKIEYRMSNKEGKVICTMSVGPQSGLGGVSLSNVGSGVNRGVSLKAEVTGISWTRSGTFPGCTTSGSGGKMNGTPTLMGVG